MSFLLYPGLGLSVWVPVPASSLGSGLRMDHGPVVYVVNADCFGTILGVSRMAPALFSPPTVYILTSGWSTAELPEAPIFWSLGSFPPATPTYEEL